MSTPAPGRLYGVGLGPGDPNLMTLRAVQVIADADVVAYHSARHGRSIARSIAAAHLRPDHIEEALVYPVTTGTTDHPGGYQGAMDDFYEACAERLAVHLDAGRTVAVISEGDPLFYGSYMHMHKRLAHRYPTEVIPGVTSVSAASARLGAPLVEGEEVLTILPGTLPEEELTARLAATDSAVVMKLGRTFPAVRGALEASGRLAEARYVERATMEGERTGHLADTDPESVPYFAVAVVPSRVAALPVDAPATGQAAVPAEEEAAAVPAGEVVVVGTGPAGPLWLTPRPGARSPPPRTLSATPPTSTGCRTAPARSGTAPTTRSRPNAPSSPSTWPAGAAASPSSPAATRGSSPWPPPSWRPPPKARTGTCRSVCCPGSPPPTPPPPAPGRRSATTTR